MDETTALGVAAIAGAVATDAGKKLIGPVAEQVGQAAGDLAGIYRFYQNRFLGSIFTKWAAARGDKPPLTEEEFLRVLPLLRLAANASDEDLQARWAALLEHTATSPDVPLPGFAQTLSELTPQEAQFLDRLYAALVRRPAHDVSGEYVGARPFDDAALMTIFDSSIDPRMPDAELLLSRGTEPTEEQRSNAAKVEQAKLVINDLERHGIIAQYQITQPERWYPVPHLVGNYEVDPVLSGRMIPIRDHVPDLRTYYGLSPYGVSFIHAVSPKKLA